MPKLITVTSLTSGGEDGPPSPSFTVDLPSVSVAMKSLLVLWVASVAPVSVSGLGATWTQAATASCQLTQLIAFTAIISHAVSGVITMTVGGQTPIAWDLDQALGVNLTTPFVAANTQLATTATPSAASVTFAAASDAANRFLFATAAADLSGSGCSPAETPTAWTELADAVDPAVQVELETQVSPSASELTAVANWVGDRFGWGAIGFELGAA